MKNPRIDKNKVALMKLICQLSDGESCECRYSAEREGDETILESAVFSIKAVANSLPDNLKSEAAKVAAMIKFQVMVSSLTLEILPVISTHSHIDTRLRQIVIQSIHFTVGSAILVSQTMSL